MCNLQAKAQAQHNWFCIKWPAELAARSILPPPPPELKELADLTAGEHLL